MLAVSERTRSVLPGFPPIDRRQADEQGVLCHVRVPLHPDLEFVVIGRVVIQPGFCRQPLDGRRNEVSFRRVEVAAGWVAPKRPSAVEVLLPRGQGKAVVEKEGDRGSIQRLRRNRCWIEDRVVWRVVRVLREIE